MTYRQGKRPYAQTVANPWRFLSVALMMVVSIVAFVAGVWIVGIVTLGVALLLLALRITLIVMLRRAEARAVDNPPPPPDLARIHARVRRLKLTYAIVFGLFAVAGVLLAVFGSNEFQLIGLVLAVVYVTVGVTMWFALTVGEKRALARLTALPEFAGHPE